MPPSRPNWIDRAISYVAPRAGLRRIRARVVSELLLRHYEGAAAGRRTQGWNRSGADANAAAAPSLAHLRNTARDLVRSNPNAKAGLRIIANHVVGWGIVAKPAGPNPRRDVLELWQRWAETTACDSDGRQDFYGLQKMVIRTVAESGECLVRRRIRRPEDGLPIPMQLQVIEPDYIDTSKTGVVRNAAGEVVRRIVHGIEYNTIGQRTAYWLFADHPGSEMATGTASYAVPAESIRHVFYPDRPGQVRGVSWFAPVILRLKDFDEYEDAQLMKQKISACLAVITSDPTGTAPPLGTADDGADPMIDSLEPGMIINAAPGRGIDVVQPPSVREYSDYARTSLRAIATGLGVTYEDLTGDYSDMPFSAARMSRLAHWDRIEDWRWQMLIPQFCDPAWQWAMEVAGIMGVPNPPAATWTPPPAPMVDPVNEGLAYQRNIRTGFQTLSEVIRERGFDPEAVLNERRADDEKLDRLGIILDSDPRRTTQGGNPYKAAEPEPDTPRLTAGADDEGGTDGDQEDGSEDAGGRSRARRPKGAGRRRTRQRPRRAEGAP